MTPSRRLALALLVLALLLGGLLLGYPLSLLLGGSTEEISDLAFRAERLRRVAASAEAWRNRAAAIRQQVTETEQFLDGGTPALAAAALQASLKEMIGSAGGNVASSQSTPPKEEQGFTRIGVRTVLTGSVDTLRDLLYLAETARPFLLIGHLNITPRRSGVVAMRNNAAANKQQGLLTVDIEVYGYMKPQNP